MPKASLTLLTLMMMTLVAGTLFAAPSSSLAQEQQQQTNTGTATVTTPPPLTPEEQQQQERLQSVINATTRNLLQGQKQIDGLVYTPRWSNATWVEPDSLSIAFAYCLPGEFAESGQHIIGGSDLEVLESYVLAITNNLTGWLIVVENENENARLPAAAGAICSSDANVTEARLLSPQEQIVINNIINQFTTVRNDITQVINIINNVTRPPPNNNTGGGNNTDPLTVQAMIADIRQEETPWVLFETLTDGGRPPYACEWDFGDGATSDECGPNHIYQNPGTYTASVTVTDYLGQTASDATEQFTITNTGNNTGRLTVSAVIEIDQIATPVVRFDTYYEGGIEPHTCEWDLGDGTTVDTCFVSHIYRNPGTYTATVTVTDATGQTASDPTEEFLITNTGNNTDPLTAQALIDIDQEATPVVVFDALAFGGIAPHTCEWDLGDGTTVDTCYVSHIYENTGTYTATVTVTDYLGQTASDATEPFTITNTGGGGGGNNTITVEELPVDVPPPTDDTGGEATPPPTNNTGG
jgi:PKD repeat protein